MPSGPIKSACKKVIFIFFCQEIVFLYSLLLNAELFPYPPNRTFHNFCASNCADQHILGCPETSIKGFGGYKIVECLVGHMVFSQPVRKLRASKENKLKGKWKNKMPSVLVSYFSLLPQLPDRAYYNSRAPKSTDWRNLFRTYTSVGGFSGFQLGKGWSGISSRIWNFPLSSTFAA